jgi:hypothetical protein
MVHSHTEENSHPLQKLFKINNKTMRPLEWEMLQDISMGKGFWTKKAEKKMDKLFFSNAPLYLF